MDWFLLFFLIPLILVPIVLLCGFAGCAQVAGIKDIQIIPPAPSNLVAKTCGTSRVCLSWKDNSGGIVKFTVFRAITGPGGGSLSPVGSTSATFFGDTGLAAGTNFLY